MRLTEAVRAHLVGISGAGLSSLATFLTEGGTKVTGSDMHPGGTANLLGSVGIQVWSGHDPSHVDFQGGIVVASAAIPAVNPELSEARRRGLPVYKYSDAIGEISGERLTLAVAGTHGKTSTCGLTVCALRGAGIDPGYLVGGTLAGEPLPGGRRGADPCLVVEACEYDRSFLRLQPWALAVLNVDPDHFDCYPSEASLVEAFQAFLERVRPGGLVVLHEQAWRVLEFQEVGLARSLLVGEGPGADLRAVQLEEAGGCYSFYVEERGHRVARVELKAPGRHLVGNSLVALALAREGGADIRLAAAGVAGYRGMGRRFEVRRGRGGGILVSDYAHHPTELLAVLDAGRHVFPGRRLVAFFQPHQYSRTRNLLDGFAAALRGFDRVLLADIYAARDREEDRQAVTSADLADRIRRLGGEVELVGAARDAADRALGSCRGSDEVLFLLGAGDIGEAADSLLARL